MKRPHDADAGKQGRERGRGNKETGRQQGEPLTIQHIQRRRLTKNGQQDPSPSLSLTVIFSICSVRAHPREFLFVLSDRFVSGPIPALADDTAEPFTSSLHGGRGRQSMSCGTTGMSAPDQGGLF